MNRPAYDAPDNNQTNFIAMASALREAPCLFDGTTRARRKAAQRNGFISIRWANNMMLQLTASNGSPLWINPQSVRALRAPVPAEKQDDKEVKAVIFVTDAGWHVRNTPEEIIKALGKY